MDSEKKFRTKTGYCHILADKIILTRDGIIGNVAKVTVINSAIFRATDCSSDPICIESEGQGVGHLNLAACHSCTLTPETTCELSNLYPDRNLVVNNGYGYFKSNFENE